ncbi:MAG: NCS2 family permease [Lachnospiraceae bacterium]|nr:NCS2 family permease [Lachnospiraceae bacterium]
MDKFFKIKERGSSVKMEIIGGLTTFFAMAYIVFVNPNQVAGEGATGWLAGAAADAGIDVAGQLGQIWNSVFVASILGAIIGTLLMAFLANMPYAQACGMGLNAFFCTCFISASVFGGVDVVEGYHAGMVIIFVSGLVFLFLSVTGAREYIAKAMPECLKKAIPAGIGLFIAMIGMKNAGLIQANQYTFVQFVDIHGGKWADYAPAIAAFIGLLLIAVFEKYKIKGSVIISILLTTVIYYVFMNQVPSFDVSAIGQTFRDFGSVGVVGLLDGKAWSDAFVSAPVGGVFNAVMLIITFCLVDMFDTIGTLYGTASQAGMLDENGDPINVNKSMLCDSIATVCGAALGTSTCTTFVESSSGVAAGARTGLASVVTSICFALCLFLSPLASMIPSAATAPALIYVGVLMMKSFAKVDMDDIASAVPAFLALIMMPLTYSIANGIGIGAIAYVIITLFTGRYQKKDVVITIIAALFVLKFIFVTM